MKVTYWSDYACPYCYIGETRLKNAMQALGADGDIEVEMKAFQLYPGASQMPEESTQERFALKYGLSSEEAARRIESISRLGRAEGLEFNYSSTRNSNTMDAHRLTKLAHALGNDTFEELCYAAYFGDNQVLADHGVLRKIAQTAGLPDEEVERVLAGDAYREDVLADEREAAERGIHGVPYFLLDGKVAIPGAWPADKMKAALQSLLDVQKEVEPSQGMTCGIEGCDL